MSYFDKVDPVRSAYVCNRCGALVMLSATHEAWHRKNDRLEVSSDTTSNLTERAEGTT